MYVNYEIDVDEVLNEAGEGYVRAYFGLYDEAFIDDLEETHEGEVKALTEKIDSLTMELELLKGNE